jgi:hypothetical protein
VIQIESETADFERFCAAFMLAGIDPCVQRLEHLVIARKQRLAKDIGIAPVKGRLNRRRGDGDAGVNGPDVGLLPEATTRHCDEDCQSHQSSATNYKIVTTTPYVSAAKSDLILLEKENNKWLGSMSKCDQILLNL